MSAEQNKVLVRHLLEEIWRGNLDVLNQHPGMHESIPFITRMRESVATSQSEIVQQLTAGDWVVTRFTSSDTLAKAFMGSPAGTHVKVETIMMHKIQDGKIVEQHTQGGRVE